MKYLLILIFWIYSVTLNAQSWQKICTPGITFFKNNNGNIKAFRLDSIRAQGNNDTIYYSYRTIRYLNIFYCHDTTNGSILGMKVFKKHDGTFLFFNHNHDTITIKTGNPLNQSWKFCNLPEGSFIQAKPVSLEVDSILGFSDSVKVISLQAINNGGLNIPHYLNNRKIRLSKNFGLSSTLDFYFVPDSEYQDSTEYSLAGKSNPSLGVQAPTWEEIFNYEAGDEFHFEGQNGYYYYQATWEEIKKVLSKSIYGNVDSVMYLIEHCKITHFPQPPPNTEIIYDTIVEKYNFIQMTGDSIIIQPPEIFSPTYYPNMNAYSSVFKRMFAYNDRQTQDYSKDEIIYSSCWSIFDEGVHMRYTYTAGLGQTFFERIVIDQGITDNKEYLVFYKKGSETWGTPLAPACNILLGERINNTDSTIKVCLFPNPVRDDATFEFSGVPANVPFVLGIFSNKGQKVLDKHVSDGTKKFYFDRIRLSRGLYFYRLTSFDGQLLGQGKFVIE